MADLRVVVVDDEPVARRGLVRLCASHPGVNVVGECRNGREAVQTLKTVPCDLVFLDVKMPDLDGFAVLRALDPAELPIVVFVTAYDEYAVRAFDVHAVDYLVKPFSDARFEMTLARARGYAQQRQAAELATRLAGLLADAGMGAQAGAAGATAAAPATNGNGEPAALKLVANLGQKAQVVPVREIDWVEAQDYCVLIHVGKASYLLRESIRSLQRRLEPVGFLRVHRSAMVNVDRVRELRRPARGEWMLELVDGTELPVSRRNRATLLQTVDRLAR
jgi:two-component system LytT family response regulator